MGLLSFLQKPTEPVVSQELLDKHWHINVEPYCWYADTYLRFKCDMAEIGVSVGDIQFSGFYSQGDGASFTGTISTPEDTPKFLSVLDTDFPTIQRLMQHGGDVVLRVRRGTSRYSHENTVHMDIETCRFDEVLSDHEAVELRQVIVGQWNDALDSEIAILERVAMTYLRTRMSLLYHDLEREYEYLTSDEAVRETIIANDLHEEN